MEQEQLVRENARRAALGLEPIASLEDLDTSVDVPGEILLDQAARVVVEMALLDEDSRELVTRGRVSTVASSEEPPAATSATR
jgi:hypothetical protein